MTDLALDDNDLDEDDDVNDDDDVDEDDDEDEDENDEEEPETWQVAVDSPNPLKLSCRLTSGSVLLD